MDRTLLPSLGIVAGIMTLAYYVGGSKEVRWADTTTPTKKPTYADCDCGIPTDAIGDPTCEECFVCQCNKAKCDVVSSYDSAYCVYCQIAADCKGCDCQCAMCNKYVPLKDGDHPQGNTGDRHLFWCNMCGENLCGGCYGDDDGRYCEYHVGKGRAEQDGYSRYTAESFSAQENLSGAWHRKTIEGVSLRRDKGLGRSTYHAEYKGINATIWYLGQVNYSPCWRYYIQNWNDIEDRMDVLWNEGCYKNGMEAVMGFKKDVDSGKIIIDVKSPKYNEQFGMKAHGDSKIRWSHIHTPNSFLAEENEMCPSCERAKIGQDHNRYLVCPLCDWRSDEQVPCRHLNIEISDTDYEGEYEGGVIVYASCEDCGADLQAFGVWEE